MTTSDRYERREQAEEALRRFLEVNPHLGGEVEGPSTYGLYRLKTWHKGSSDK